MKTQSLSQMNQELHPLSAFCVMPTGTELSVFLKSPAEFFTLQGAL
jgi:hypothetical protein